MAQPEEAQERSPRVRKDAKIALIVILALMVLVVVIWGRSPRPEDQLATTRPSKDAAKDTGTDPATPAKSDPGPGDADLARADTSGISSFPGDGAMMNHVQPADRAVVRNDPTAPTDGRDTARADASKGGPTPAGPADGVAPAPLPAPRPPAVTHTVVKGDTFTKLAVKYYKDQAKWHLIQQANRGVATLQIGQKITIPPLPDAPARTTDTTPAGATPGGTTPPATDRPSPDSTPRPAPAPVAPSSGKTYTVQKGDTFMKIARSIYRDPAKWRTLYERNRAKLPDPAKPDSLRPGTVIEVPALASTR